ncbi:hypothetical protein Q5752_003441 [Cryptotrichosporon argae]
MSASSFRRDSLALSRDERLALDNPLRTWLADESANTLAAFQKMLVVSVYGEKSVPHLNDPVNLDGTFAGWLTELAPIVKGNVNITFEPTPESVDGRLYPSLGKISFATKKAIVAAKKSTISALVDGLEFFYKGDTQSEKSLKEMAAEAEKWKPAEGSEVWDGPTSEHPTRARLRTIIAAAFAKKPSALASFCGTFKVTDKSKFFPNDGVAHTFSSTFKKSMLSKLGLLTESGQDPTVNALYELVHQEALTVDIIDQLLNSRGLN